MLQFYYDFMDKFVNQEDFEYYEMDTDSAYMALAGSDLESVIKLRDQYMGGLQGCNSNIHIQADADHHWFPHTCCKTHAKYTEPNL